MLPFEEYSVALICALPIEVSAVGLLLDQTHKTGFCIRGGNDIYILGCICGHNVVVTYLPSGGYGTTSAAAVVTEMLSAFRPINYGILVGIAGGVPSRKNDIRLSDVVVSTPSRSLGGVIQYDFLKDHPNASQEHIGALNKPHKVLLSATSCVRKNHLKGYSKTPSSISYMAEVCEKFPQFRSPGVAQNILFEPNYHHNTVEDKCATCLSKIENIISRPARERSDPYIHYGTVGSGNRVIEDDSTRDTLARAHDILCFEMEAAGLMDSLPCLVIRGISDYADSHKNKDCYPYAALAAAAYAKEVLSVTSFARTVSPVEEKLLEAVLDVLFVCLPEDDRSDLIDVKGKRAPGTCEWFLKDPKYLAWSSRTTSEVLVVAGRAGQGKTMLAIHVTEVLEEVATEKQGTLLYIFCSSKDEQHSTGTTILRSLLYQLLKQNPHVLRLVRAHFATPNIQNHTISGVTPLWRLFVDLLRNGDIGPVYCVEDGLDECDKVSTQQLLTKISRLQENLVHRLNLLFFCREGLAWIEDKLGVFPCMDLDSNRSKKTSNDMEK